MLTLSDIKEPIIADEKWAQENLVRALYKTGYCICIPNLDMICLQIKQVDLNWLQELLLKKNAQGDSILARLLNLALQNKMLTQKKSSVLFQVINVLLNILDRTQISYVLIEARINQLPVVFNLLYQMTRVDYLMKKTARHRSRWCNTTECMVCLELFFTQSSPRALDCFVRYSLDDSFLLLKQLFDYLSHTLVPKVSLTFFILVAEKIIEYFPPLAFNEKMQEKEKNGFSILWNQLFKGIRLFAQALLRNQNKIPIFIILTVRLLEKTAQETRYALFFEQQGEGCLLLLSMIMIHDHVVRNGLSLRDERKFDRWLNLLVSSLNPADYKQILNQGIQLIDEQTYITFAKKKTLIKQWSEGFITFFDPNQKTQAINLSTSKKVHFQQKKKNRRKKNIFSLSRLFQSWYVFSTQENIEAANERTPLLAQANFF